MSGETILEILRGVRFLHDMDDAHLKPLAEIATIREVPAGVVLFREGHPHAELYLIVEGAVALEIRVAPQAVKRIQTIGAGELLGWSPLVEPSAMTATGRTLRPTRVAAIDGAQLMALCEHDPRFGFDFMKRMVQALARRLGATRLQLLDVYNQELPALAPGQEI